MKISQNYLISYNNFSLNITFVKHVKNAKKFTSGNLVLNPLLYIYGFLSKTEQKRTIITKSSAVTMCHKN